MPILLSILYNYDFLCFDGCARIEAAELTRVGERQLLFELQCLQRSKAKRKFRKDIFDSWGCCAYCGATRPTTLDHVLAQAHGGLTVKNNLVAACAGCNLKKGSLDFMEWFRSQTFWSSERELRLLAWIHQT